MIELVRFTPVFEFAAMEGRGTQRVAFCRRVRPDMSAEGSENEIRSRMRRLDRYMKAGSAWSRAVGGLSSSDNTGFR